MRASQRVSPRRATHNHDRKPWWTEQRYPPCQIRILTRVVLERQTSGMPDNRPGAVAACGALSDPRRTERPSSPCTLQPRVELPWRALVHWRIWPAALSCASCRAGLPRENFGSHVAAAVQHPVPCVTPQPMNDGRQRMARMVKTGLFLLAVGLVAEWLPPSCVSNALHSRRAHSDVQISTISPYASWRVALGDSGNGLGRSHPHLLCGPWAW